MIKLSLKIGRFPIVIEFNDMKSLHKFGSVYGNLPPKCDKCGSDNLFLSYKSPKGNDYFTLQCGDCTADANFGIHNNESKSLYWKREKMEVFQGAKQDNDPNNLTGPQAATQTFNAETVEPADSTESPF